MAINKVIFNDNTIMDITDTTAVASDVSQGKYFYGADGVKTLGTLVQNLGLEYEEGTFKPSEDILQPTINFTKTHETLPVFWTIYDSMGEAPTQQGITIQTYVDYYRLFGVGYYMSPTSFGYSFMQTGTCRVSMWENSYTHFYYSSDETRDDKSTYPRYYFNNTCIKPTTKQSSYGLFRTDRTYKWLAIWK